jgi:hypothetical protein
MPLRVAGTRQGKKSPANWRGKTDSLEISQRGKTCIYTKFMRRGKRKTNEKWALAESNPCKNAPHSSRAHHIGGKQKVMLHNFAVSRVLAHGAPPEIAPKTARRGPRTHGRPILSPWRPLATLRHRATFPETAGGRRR